MYKYLAKRFNKMAEEDRMRLPRGLTTLIPNRESAEVIDLRIVCLHYKKLKSKIRKRM
jgi:hypothetical protein